MGEGGATNRKKWYKARSERSELMGGWDPGEKDKQVNSHGRGEKQSEVPRNLSWV